MPSTPPTHGDEPGGNPELSPADKRRFEKAWEHIAEGNRLREAEQMEFRPEGLLSAIRQFERALDLVPDLPEALLQIGAACSDLAASVRCGEEMDPSRLYEITFAAYERAAAADPTSPKAHCALGSMHSFVGVFDKDSAAHRRAVDAYRKAIDVDRDCADAYTGLGKAYANLEEYDNALAALHTALVKKPECPIALDELGRVHERLGHMPEAIAAYEKSIAATDPRFILPFSLGMSHADYGKPVEAIAAFKVAASRDGDHPAVYYRMGEEYEKIGMPAEALSAYRKVLELGEGEYADSASDAYMRLLAGGN